APAVVADPMGGRHGQRSAQSGQMSSGRSIIATVHWPTGALGCVLLVEYNVLSIEGPDAQGPIRPRVQGCPTGAAGDVGTVFRPSRTQSGPAQGRAVISARREVICAAGEASDD